MQSPGPRFLVSALFVPIVLCASCVLATAAQAQSPPLPPGPRSQPLQPFGAPGSAPAAPWHVAGLPGQTKPFTQFSVVDLDGRAALRVEADASYGNLVHPLHDIHAHQRLAWDWRVDTPNPAVDLHTRAGDDTALKVCVLWDLPIERIPFLDRQLLRAARARSAEPLPAATVCYVWDAHLLPGTHLDNAFTRRLRYVVLRGEGAPLHQWESEQRDITADFLALFGDEAAEVPAVLGVGVGADADNTHGHSVAAVAGLHFTDPAGD